ncbi:MAG TPA: sn-glycerol-1-phosphate dehydrogenase [Candidatus Merdivicinus intestinavium]|nr:sn-glycerol-1-phosphate dehydrogenase [Candidatus Merdivicinus intestinavium]
MTIQQYIGREFPCSCGRTHSTGMKIADISSGASRRLVPALRELGRRRVFWVADENTWPILGRQAAADMNEAGIAQSGVILPGEPHADELGIGQTLMHLDRDADVLLAIGSGTINDITKFVSHRLHKPYVILASAPSMDGFASNVAAMTTDRMKTTYEAHIPEAFLADLDVLSKAPMEMIAAGVGDILGKYNALCDWKIGKIITGEYYCEEIVRLMREAVEKVVESIPGLKERRPEAYAGLTEALVLSGIAMGFAGNSRPASGSEHHLSHFWEMRYLFEGRKALLHGTKVGVGTVLSIRMAEKLLNMPADFEKGIAHARNFDWDDWKARVEKGYGPAAGSVFELEKTARKNDAAAHAQRMETIRAHWDEITAAMRESLPASAKVAGMLRELGGPADPEEIGVEPSLVEEAILLAKELRSRYTILQLLWDLGLLEEFAAEFSGKAGK